MKSMWMISVAALAFVGCSQSSETAPATTGQTDQTQNIDRNPTKDAYFGDLHVHTQNSFDAFIFNVRTTPEDAYRFARGEAIQHGGGFNIQLAEPLDFLAVTDHGEYLGIVPAMADPSNPLSQTATAQASFGNDIVSQQRAFQNIGRSFVQGRPIQEINDQAYMDSVWADTIAAAEAFNAPGVFTSFAGYEFTAMVPIDADFTAAANLHRNVIFKDDAPIQIFSTLQSPNPEDLWAWMQEQRNIGIDSLAIPHNSNASNGGMFAGETYLGGPMTSGYIKTRLANEPLVEISQIKGTSETHPMLSPNDEWADFEQYEYFIGSSTKATVSRGDFVRSALARGLAIEEATGFNPFHFGLISSSDTHLGAATLNEETHWGKFTTDGASAEARASVPPAGTRTWDAATSPADRLLSASQYSAGGLAGVWAEANTRADLFDAMRARETFGTTGPRIRVRFFAGSAFEPDLINAPDLLEQAYADGVPMGGELETASPAFLAWAVRDPRSAPLERLQIIKVWSDQQGFHEAIYDVACSGDAGPDPETHRCPDNGSSVDTSTCETHPGTGASDLRAYWTDHSFVPGDRAAYYVRVLENETCRWSTWDAVRNGTPPNPNLPITLQERAWSSPIQIKPLQ